MAKLRDGEAELTATWYRGQAEGLDRAGGVVLNASLECFRKKEDRMANFLRDLSLSLGREAEEMRKKWLAK